MYEIVNNGGKLVITITPTLSEDFDKWLMGRDLRDIATIISREWKKPYFGAVPYLQAMDHLRDIKDNYFLDSGESIVSYFLCNANTWKGPIAKAVKNELKRRIKELENAKKS